MRTAILEMKIEPDSIRRAEVPPDFGALLGQLQKFLAVLNTMGRSSQKDVAWRVRSIARNSPVQLAVEAVNQDAQRPAPLVRVSESVFSKDRKSVV